MFLSQDCVSKSAMLCFWDAFQTFYWVNVFPQFLGITIANLKSRNNLEQKCNLFTSWSKYNLCEKHAWEEVSFVYF